jgi:hypothetical protein
MFKKLLITLLILGPTMTFAQDTTKIQTLTFSDITKRSGTWSFPDSTKKWEKILMHYTLKCDPKTTRDNFNCGEWDYLSYITLKDSTGRIDSLQHQQSTFMVADLSPDTFKMMYTRPFERRQYYNYNKVVTSTSSVDSATIGRATTSTPEFFATPRSQLVYTATELKAGGFTAGNITGLNFISGSVGNLPEVEIRMMATTISGQTDLINGPFQTVFKSSISMKRPGRIPIDFIKPFNWDGTSNIVLDVIRNPKSGTGSISVRADTNSTNRLFIPTTADKYYSLQDRAFIEIDDAPKVFADLDKEITISFWILGDESLPANTSIIDARNADNVRMLNIHMPWGNGSIYWDAPNGNRINKASVANDYKNQWNHWAFVKNGTTGSMKIYKNGVLWHSGVDKNTSLSGITRFRIGKGDNYQYIGKIDQFRIWKKELSANDINQYMNQAIESSHPQFADLLVDLDFDSNGATANELISNHTGVKAYQLGTLSTVSYEKRDRFRHAQARNLRPVVTFKRAVETSHVDSTLMTKDEKVREKIVTFFSNADTVTKVSGYDFGHVAKTYYTYDPNGAKLDSTSYLPDTTYIKQERGYFTKFQVINNVEIGRFITPYGIGLDLGPEGFEWIYDITDYAPLFHDQVTLSAGNQQELIDLRFDMIEGTPPREVKNIYYLSNRSSKRYSDIADDKAFQADTVDLKGGETYMLSTRITGHGHNGNSGGGQIHCCEWANKQHHLDINGSRKFSWDIWQNDKCALNPIIDQGGNWAPPRAGWCPGAPVDDYNFELSDIIGSDNQVVIDYDVDDVPLDNLGQGGGNYVVSMHLFEYGKVNFKNDASVIEILSPNSRDFYKKYNPTCRNPEVRIRNTGSETLTEVLISYGVVGGHRVQYLWTGSLEFMETEDVELTFNVWDWATNDARHQFFAEVSEPNGVEDEYQHNNRFEVGFTQPELLPNEIEILYRNNDIADADLTITNNSGQTVYSQIDVPSKTLKRETIKLDAGCYKLECVTAEGFGLTYPLIPQIGTGMLLVRQVGGGYRSSFNLDFGKSLTYYFTVGFMLDKEEVQITKGITSYPNPINDRVYLNIEGYQQEKMEFEIYDLQGKVVLSREQQMTSDSEIVELNLDGQLKGIYFLNVHTEGLKFNKKLIKL